MKFLEFYKIKQYRKQATEQFAVKKYFVNIVRGTNFRTIYLSLTILENDTNVQQLMSFSNNEKIIVNEK